MAVKRKLGLGKGLDALLGASRRPLHPGLTPVVKNNDTQAMSEETEDTELLNQLKELPVNVIRAGKYQPRTKVRQENLTELANSIQEQGVIQPIIVRPQGDSGYEIIAGERRWRAAQIAGLTSIPAIIREVNDQAAIALAIIENIQREDLRPLEEAAALKRLLDEFQLSHIEVAQAVGRSRTSVTNAIRLLDLGNEAMQLLEQGKLEMGHARALLTLSPELQGETAQHIFIEGLSVRQTELLVRDLKNGKALKPGLRKKTTRSIDPDIRKTEAALSTKLGANVLIQQNDKGKGKLVISYNSLDEFEGILAHIMPIKSNEDTAH